MKRIVIVTAAVIGLAAGVAFAQMEGMKHEGMGFGRSSEMTKGGQMMSQGMMQDMSGMMNRMLEMMEKMAHPMKHRTVTEHTQMIEMSKVMNEMSAVMKEMAEHMEKGTMTPAVTKKMQERIKTMKKKMEGMVKEGK